jgi:hypothetical protein
MGPGGGGMGGSEGMGRGGMERGGDMGAGAGAAMRPQRQNPFDLFAEKLKLSKDQKTEAGTILQDAVKEIAPVQQKMQQARQDLAGALINGQTGEPVEQLVKTYSTLAAQNSAIEARAFGRICKMLKPNQEKNASQAFEIMAGMFERPRGGSRGGERSER